MNPDTKSEYKELPLPQYYETNFVKKDDQGNVIKDQYGNNQVDVNLELYPNTIKSMSQKNKEEIILDTIGDQL